MVDRIRTRAELLTLYADNTNGNISEQDGRDLIMSCLPAAMKTVDETNTTTGFTNDDELFFTVEEGSVYSGKFTLDTVIDNDTLEAVVAFDVPTDVVMEWGQHVLPNQAVIVSMAVRTEMPVTADGSTKERHFIEFTIDATLNGGTVTFQFRNPDGNTSGGITVKAGSFIELFKVS